MDIRAFIDAKRHGESHQASEIQAFIHEVVSGNLPDYQLSAWLMAVCLQGMTLDETAWLTEAIVHSGEILHFEGLDKPVVDKHSTGGVGDKTTLVLSPLMAANNVYVAKLAGRGLGLTGGTIDKLEAIPGFQTALSNEQLIQQVKQIGLAVSSQTPTLCPADSKLYALRDVTATVESIPLIAASVVSKKIAAGADVIILDIKWGEGAFMKTREEANMLAKTCEAIGERLGKPILTHLSDMNPPLGYAVGHRLEVLEAIDTLQGKGPKSFTQLCLQLTAEALTAAGIFTTEAAALPQLQASLENGTALQKFKEWMVAQGGDPDIVDNPNLMPPAQNQFSILSPKTGTVTAIHAHCIAQAFVSLGGSRLQKGGCIDYAVGILLHVEIGDRIQTGEALATLHVNQIGLDAATKFCGEAFEIE